MRVLFVTSEVATLYKRGGLADVSYALPVALSRHGIETAIIMPYYASIKPSHVTCVGQMAVDFEGKRELVFIFVTYISEKNIPVYLVRHPRLNNYESPDIATIFAFFDVCVVRLLLWAPQVMEGQFDVIHCHDWHTALVPMLLGENNKTLKGSKKNTKSKKVTSCTPVEAIHAKTVMTIHNLIYRGETGIKIIPKIGLPKSIFHVIPTKLGPAIQLLREGLEYVDVITTVSPTYAKEISNSEKGFMKAVLSKRNDRVLGILNGIDQTLWDPKIDPSLPIHYTNHEVVKNKVLVKQELRKALKLPQDDVPLFGFVGRIEPLQKGVDLIRQAILELPHRAYQMVILGTGDAKEEKMLSEISRKYPNIIFVNTFDERLARRIYAGSDFMLVPSKFEPCGLTQMIAMRYGTIPIVRKTGGLADSVINGETGYVFDEYTADALIAAMKKAIFDFQDESRPLNTMMKRVMKEDFSWDHSAKEYKRMYLDLIKS